MKSHIAPPPRHQAILALAASLPAVPMALAAPLYSESFDSAASAKVLVNKQANSDLFYVDYSNLVRDLGGGQTAVTLRIPEAPSRIAGSAAGRGVLLNATYGGTARAINLLASATPGGAAQVFSGNYRVAFDMWLAMDPTATAGSTEVGLFGVGHSGSAVISYAGRASGVGTFGWASTEGGIAATNGDLSLQIANVFAFRRENLADAGLFSKAFPQGTPYANTPNNQWTRVELVVFGSKVSVFMNGVNMGEGDPAITSGFASLGYEDPFTGSTPAVTAGGAIRTNRQFGLFDNFTVDSLTALPALAIAPSVTFTPVTDPLATGSSEFTVTNSSVSSEHRVTGASVDGANAADFVVGTVFPLVIPPLESAPLVVDFVPSTPNGLKVARLTLTTNDPAQPTITVPLQARRAVNSIEGSVTTRIVSVAVENGTGTGSLTLTNNTTSPVTVNAPVFTGADGGMFTITGTFPLVIPGQESVILPVVFTPSGAKGLKSTTAEFVTTDTGVPTLSVPLISRYAFGPPLLAHYKMDDTTGTTLVDSTGASPAAALQIREAPFGFAQPSLLPTSEGTSVRLTAADTSSSGNFAISNAVHLPNVSYALWIKPEPKTNNRRLLHRSSLFTTVGTLYSLYLTPAGRLVFEVNSSTAVETADAAIQDGVVYHVVVTHSDLDGFGNTTATRTRLYVNGVLVTGKDLDVMGFTDYNLNTTSEGLYIGTATSAGQGYIGMIDDLQIYNMELTPDQVAGMYGQPGKTAFNLETLDYRITSVEYNPDSGNVTLKWNSAPGAVYSVQQSTTTSGFTDVAGQTGLVSGGVSTTATFSIGTGDRRFFQIRRTSPP